MNYVSCGKIVHEFIANIQFEVTDSVYVFINFGWFFSLRFCYSLEFLHFFDHLLTILFGDAHGAQPLRWYFHHFKAIYTHGFAKVASKLLGEVLMVGSTEGIGLFGTNAIV